MLGKGQTSGLFQNTQARFIRRTFHEPNLILIHRIKYIVSSASESISNVYFNLERLPTGLAWNFDFGTALIQTPSFLCAELNA